MPSERVQNFFLAAFSGALLLMTAAFARLAFNVNLDHPATVKPVFQAVKNDACCCQDCDQACCKTCGCKQEDKAGRFGVAPR